MSPGWFYMHVVWVVLVPVAFMPFLVDSKPISFEGVHPTGLLMFVLVTAVLVYEVYRGVRSRAWRSRVPTRKDLHAYIVSLEE
jgi:hypothetical protein